MSSLTTIRSGVCSKLNNDFDKMLNTLLGAKSTLNPNLQKFKDLLRNNSTWSASAALTNGLNQVAALANDLPTWGAADFKLIKDMILSCSYLEFHPFLSEPLNVLRTLEDTIKDNLKININNIYNDLGLPEINFANVANELSRFYNKFNFANLIPEKSKIVDCINGLCGTDIREKLTRFNMLQRLLNIGSDGSLDFEQIYSSISMIETGKQNMRRSIETVGGLMTSAQNAVTKGMDIVKTQGRGFNWI